MKIADIREVFESVQDPADAAQMRRYMRDRFEFYGVRSPERKSITRELFAIIKTEGKYDSVLFRNLWDAEQRELQYLAQEYLYHTRRWWPEDIMDDVYYALTHKSWWDTVDYLATTVVGHLWRTDPLRYTPMLRRWISDPNLWLRRTAIIAQLKHKEDVDTDFMTEAIVPNLGDSDFFIRKAIGWALRQYSKYNPDWVEQFVEQHDMSPLSHREATKYIR